MEWSRLIGGSGQDTYQDGLQNSDGTFTLCGSTSSFGEGYDDVLVSKLSEEGDLIWSKTYGGEESDSSSGIISCSSGGYLICGNSETFTEGDLNMYLVRIDTDGNLIWSNSFGGIDWESSSDVVEKPNGDFILVGRTFSYAFGGSDAYVLQIDSNGDISSSLSFGQSENENIRDIDLLSDNSFICAGLIQVNDKYEILICKFDSNFIPIWQKSIAEPSADLTAFNVEETSDGLLISASKHDDNSVDKGVLIAISENGEYMWAKEGSEIDDNDQSMTKMASSNQGETFLAGPASVDSETQFRLTKFDSDGYSSCFEDNITISISDVTFIAGSGGDQFSGGEMNTASLTVTYPGVNTNTHCFELGTQDIHTDIEISIYPNPSLGSITIDCGDVIEQIKVYSSKAVLLSTQELNASGSISQNMHFPPGIYYLKIKLENGDSVHRMVVVY